MLGFTFAALLLSGGALVADASPGVDLAPCSTPPSVDVDQSSANNTTITVEFDCQERTSFHRVITATVGGATLLEFDTATAAGANTSHATTLVVPKARVCVSDPDTGNETCVPA